MSQHKRPQPRFTRDEKRQIVAQLQRLGGGGRPLPQQMKAVAAQYGVTVRSIQLWLNDASLMSDVSGPERQAFSIDADMLTVIGNEQSRALAYAKLRTAGIIDVSYSTFCRAISNADPALVGAALEGKKALVARRMYLKAVAPYRGWVYHLDHTRMDLYVSPTHRHTKSVVRPWVTIITDGATGLIWAFPWYEPVNGTMVSAALAHVCTKQNYHGVTIGGVPEQVVLDNAGEHFTEQMAAAITRIGTLLTPTNARSSWQNGKAERAIQLINNRFSDRAPGAIRAGETSDGQPRFLKTTRAETDSALLWTATSFERALQDAVDEINTTIKMKRHGGLTRLEAWKRDQTELRFISDLAARLCALPTDKDTYKGGKGGISFRGHEYVHPDLHVGKRYAVRYLPTQDNFIEVFTVDKKHIGRAWRSDAVPSEERVKFMAARARVERDAKAIESGIQAARAHQAALDNADAEQATSQAPRNGLVADLRQTNPELAEVRNLPKKKRVKRREPVPEAVDIDFLKAHLDRPSDDRGRP